MIAVNVLLNIVFMIAVRDFVSQVRRLISSGLFGIILFTSAPALAESDNEALSKLQAQQNIMTLELRTLKNQVRSVNPTKWEVKALRSLIQESNCLSDRLGLESNIPNRSEFAIILDRCFNGLERIATAGDPDRLIRVNIATIRRLRDESNLELAKLKSIYDDGTYVQAMLTTRILSSPFWDTSISSEDMRSLRSLIYKYSAKYSVNTRLPCGGRLPLRETIGRIEYGLALISLFDQINDLIYTNIDKFDKKDLPTLMRLQNNFAAELAIYKGVLCARESPKLVEYIDGEVYYLSSGIEQLY